MKKSLILMALVAATGGAWAQASSDASAASRAESAASAGASSGSTAAGNVIYLDQSGPTQQSVTATYSTRAEQILNGHTVEEVKYSGTQTVKNVPAIAMSGPASGPCTGVSGGVGIAGPGWGFGANGSAVMVDCRLRENTRVLGMAMQSVDGGANPQEKGELMIMFMDAARGLAAYNRQVLGEELKKETK